MNWKTQAVGDTVAEVSIKGNLGGKFAVEVLTTDCRVFRLRPEHECAGKPPTRIEIGRVFALAPENWEEVKT